MSKRINHGTFSAGVPIQIKFGPDGVESVKQEIPSVADLRRMCGLLNIPCPDTPDDEWTQADFDQLQANLAKAKTSQLTGKFNSGTAAERGGV